MLVTIAEARTDSGTSMMATSVGTDAAIDANVAAGVPMHELDTSTGTWETVFDGSKWLTDRPRLGPFRGGANG